MQRHRLRFVKEGGTMYIVDADSHLSLTETPNQTAEQLIKNMDRAGITQSIIWLQPPYMRDLEEANRYIHESARKYPDRLLPIGWVDPHFGPEKSMDMLRKCLDDYGMYGVKLNGAQNLFHIDRPELDPLYEEIEKRDKILALHIGADFYDFTHPYRAGRIAKRHPKLRMLLAHMGGAGTPDLGLACMETAEECPNMLLIGSAINHRRILEGIKRLGAHRVCFGSDAPFYYQHVEVAAYQALLKDEVTAEEYELIMGKNILKFLKII